MKVKELERFAHCAWSPATCDSTILATLTAEDGNVDLPSTYTSAPPLLELFRIRWDESQLDMPPSASINVELRSTSLCWSQPNSAADLGFLISGSSSGDLVLYNPQILLAASDDSEFDLLSELTYASKAQAHTGVVRGLDANHFQTNLFASASDESEIYIWDVEKFDQPMSPGNKIQPPELTSTIAWNPHVQHILATTCAGHCTIWDLRRSDPVVHLTKAMCQFEPHLMAWSPDVATRLCLADPSHPTADVLLWDLRYPKHMLALLARWPPPSCGVLDQAALGYSGTVNALAWSPAPLHGRQCKPGSSLHDPDLLAVSISASGALPTPEGGRGSGLEPTSGDFLVVWSISEALKSAQSETISANVSRQPVFVGRLGGYSIDNSSSPIVPDSLPTNSAVHWLPTQPGLVGITQSDGWISVLNLMSGMDKPSAASYMRLIQRSGLTRASRSRHTSHKVAEAFGEEVDLSDFSTKDNTDSLTQLTEEFVLSDPTLISWDKSAVQQNDVNQPQSFPQLPQPLPCLRIAPRWTRRPHGASFSFGGRLVWFTSVRCDRSMRARTLSNQSGAGTGLTSDFVTSAASKNVSELVHLDWIDTTGDVCVPGMKASAEEPIDVRQTLVLWLKDAVNQPACQLNDLFRYLDDLFEPSAIECKPSRIHPWKLIQTRLQSADQLVPAFSDQLGFNIQNIRSQVENVLIESPTSMQLQEDPHSQAIATLNVLKMALITADFASSIQLCSHRTLTALSCKTVSPLSAVAIILATLTDNNKLNIATHHSILSALTQATSTEPALHTVTLLLSGLILGDWVSVFTAWPLTDWTAALATIVNHTLSQDASLFRNLCGILISRCLSLSEHCDLSSTDRYMAAWTCAVLCCDLDAIIQSWYGMHSLVDMELQGDQLLPLALQLTLIGKCLDESAGLIPSVSKLFSTVATWLGQIRSGHSEDDVLLALQLLHRFTLGSESVSHSTESEELAHRLWCSLSDTARQQLIEQFKLKFPCPFGKCPVSVGHQCPCGLRLDAMTSPSYSHHTATHLQPSFPVRSSTPNHFALSNLIPAATSTSYGYQTGSAPSSNLGPIIDSSQYAPSVPMYTPAATPNEMVFSVEPQRSMMHTATLPQFPSPTPPQPFATFPQPPQFDAIPPRAAVPTPPVLTPPPPYPRSLKSDGFTPNGYSTAFMGTSVFCAPTPPCMVQTAQQGILSKPPALPPMSSVYTNRSWNDPPLLAPTYRPVRPIVSQNNFYDPTQFSAMITQPPAPYMLPSVESHSPSLPVHRHVAPNTLGTLTHEIHSPLTETLPTVNASYLHPPPSTASSQQRVVPFSSGSTVCPPVAVPLSKSHHPVAYADERLGYEVSPLTPNARLLYSSGNQDSGCKSEQWPAAQPLCTPSIMVPATPDLTHGVRDEMLHNFSSPAPSDESDFTTISSEFAAIEGELIKLVQLCRTVGGKTFVTKMDIVERRLSTLFSIFRRWPSESHTLSTSVLSHLKDCVLAASQSDFAKAVEHANLLIQSASGFESIHSFAPGLKILMQSARQLFPSISESDHPYPTVAQCIAHSST